MHATSQSLSPNIRARSIEILNEQLALALDAKLQAKQAHWNVKGPSFIALHELFDSVATEADGWSDLLAERITAMGGTAEGTLQAVSARTKLAAYPLEISQGPDHVKALAGSIARFAANARESIDQSTGLGDAVTADVFTEVARAADKQLWFVEAHLGGR